MNCMSKQYVMEYTYPLVWKKLKDGGMDFFKRKYSNTNSKFRIYRNNIFDLPVLIPPYGSYGSQVFKKKSLRHRLIGPSYADCNNNIKLYYFNGKLNAERSGVKDVTLGRRRLI